MSDRLPGTSYDNPVWHRNWRIYLNDNGLRDHHSEWSYVHDDFDGDDGRYGYAASVEDAREAIDDLEEFRAEIVKAVANG
ncbi:hypothetical protein WJS89_10430 [Sphingomicrobium sp. XHP0235]|uniref:hypothetical protein n=1 Tax=Sphingomicrobium aquimarinum TaxID=3133971 RepID=UPI0031FEDF49